MFNPSEYWKSRGQNYRFEARLLDKYFRDQEDFLVETILPYAPKHIVELGCGFGRVTKVLARAFPGTSIYGLDLSSHQVSNAQIYCSEYSYIIFDCLDFVDVPVTPGSIVDMVVAIEVFEHLPPDHLCRVVKNLFWKNSNPALRLVHDYHRNGQKPLSAHCFDHDYRVLYRELELTVTEADRGEFNLLIVEKGLR